MGIIEKLKQILQETGWSQDQLAHRLEVSNRALSFWITGKATPHPKKSAEIDTLYFDIVGRKTVSPDFLHDTESKALTTRIELDELLENEELLKTTTLYLTYHTNTIEGSTMTIQDVEKVLNDENTVLPDKTVREQLETRNHRTAFYYLLAELKKQGQNFQWSEELIKNIHLRLMNSIMESAGHYRLHRVRIIGSKTPLVDYTLVPERVQQLVEYMNTPCDNLIERLAVTHATFEQIHPFGDGNGRTGRLIMFAQALQGGIVPPLVLKERKKAYYKYLETAQLEGQYDLLRLFVAESSIATDNLLRS